MVDERQDLAGLATPAQTRGPAQSQPDREVSQCGSCLSEELEQGTEEGGVSNLKHLTHVSHQYHCTLFSLGAEEPPTSTTVRVVETEYQPINTVQRDVVVTEEGGSGRRGRGRRRGDPSLLRVLLKTYYPELLLSIVYRIPSDLIVFANPLLLK